jgi:Phytanoyl-CoA dioxygenase (PhyH)
MSFSALQKVASGLWNRGNRKTPVYRDLPASLDYRKDALERLAKEAQIAPPLLRELVQRFPALSGSIRSMVQNMDEFVRTGITPQEGYYQFRNLYFQTSGASNDQISGKLATIFPKPVLPQLVRSVIGDFRSTDVLSIVAELQRNGVFRLKTKLPAELVEALQKGLPREATKNDANATLTSYREYALLACPEFVQLSADPLFYHVASQYLGIEPVLSFISAWITRPHQNDQSTLSANAQLFHVDMSNPTFLKVFIYLNDVTERNGPHCLVPRTHKEKVPELWRDGRISDAEMSAHYPESTWDYQIGGAGSVFFVDTKAFHKGMPLIEGERHAAQFYYVDTLFGEHVRLDAETPLFRPDRFGPGILDYGPRFLSRYALAQ